MSKAFPTRPPAPKIDVVYYSARDLAQRYHVHEITIHKWSASGTLPKGELIGPNTRRWRSDLLEDFEFRRREVQSQQSK